MVVRMFNNNSKTQGSSGQAQATEEKKIKQESPKKSWQKYRQGSGKDMGQKSGKGVNKQAGRVWHSRGTVRVEAKIQ